MREVYVDAYIQPKPSANERAALIEMLNSTEYKNKTLFIADRGYCSWNLFTHFKYKNNADFLFRVNDKGYRIIKEIPFEEYDIDKHITLTTNQHTQGKKDYVVVQKLKGTQKNRKYKENRVNKPVRWDFADYEQLSVRIIRFKLAENHYETIFTER